jgi:hypothetical protein
MTLLAFRTDLRASTVENSVLEALRLLPVGAL